MPVYQVMLTYLITVESKDEEDAAVAAMNLIQLQYVDARNSQGET